MNKTYLNVPYKEKDEAKALGAWWDADTRKWFVPNGLDPRPFERWMEQNTRSQQSGKAEH